MGTQAWLVRLARQLPGWKVWVASGPEYWRAAPAPDGLPLTDAHKLPNQLTARTPQLLRELARERYGWNDTCDTCGVLARSCGHRQPETRD